MNGPISMVGGIALLAGGVVSTLGGVGLYEVASVVLGARTSPVQITELDVFDPLSDVGGVRYRPYAAGYAPADPLRAVWEGWVVRIGSNAGTDKICQGDGLGRYSARADAVNWSLGYMTGDPGCAERLAAGQYELVVKLTPLDDRPSIQRSATFTIEADDR